jgi:hypothetical protein
LRAFVAFLAVDLLVAFVAFVAVVFFAVVFFGAAFFGEAFLPVDLSAADFRAD